MVVGLIKKLFTDYLQDISPKMVTAEEIDKAWERYKTLNHLWQDEQPKIGEEDACEFAEWMRLNCKSSQNGWVDALGKWDTTKGWYELYKQQKGK